MNHYDVKATRLRLNGKYRLDLLIKTICFTRYSIARFYLHYSPLLALSPLASYCATIRSTSPSHAPQALSNLAPYRTTTRSSSPSHVLLALSTLAPYRTTARSSSRHHTLRITQSLSPRHPLTLQNPPQHPLFCNPKYHGRRCEKACRFQLANLTVNP